MKTIIGVVLIGLFAFGNAVYSEDYYYYNGAERVDLNVSPSSVTIRLDQSQTMSFSALFASDPALDSSVAPFKLADSLVRLAVLPGYNIDSLVSRLVSHPNIEDACPAFIDPDGAEIYLTSRLVVVFDSSVTKEVIEYVISYYNLTLVDSLFGDYRFQVLRARTHSLIEVVSIANAIYGSGLASIAEPSWIPPMKPLSDPNDEYWGYQWYFKNTGQFGGTPGADIDLELTRLYYMPTTPILVAVLDEGFEPHEDFPAGRIANGYDYYGWQENEAPVDPDAHGMAVTGIIAAMTDDSIGVASFSNYNVRVLNQKIMEHGGFDDWGSVAIALNDAVDSGAVVISNSYGHWLGMCRHDAGFDQALVRTYYAGVVNVFGSGNDQYSRVCYPACHPLTIAVGASDSLDHKWNYSQYGDDLDVLAPSGALDYRGDIWTLDRMGALGKNDGSVDCQTQDANYLCGFGGTSAAAPQVAGIALLVMLRRPDLIGHPDRVRRIIRLSAEREQYGVYDTVRVNNYYGWGRVNADRALLSVTHGDANNDGLIDLDDIIYLINFAFGGGSEPVPHLRNGDANCS